MKKIAFALAAGNTFILKPSDLAPLSGLKIAEGFHAAGLHAGARHTTSAAAAAAGKFLQNEWALLILFRCV